MEIVSPTKKKKWLCEVSVIQTFELFQNHFASDCTDLTLLILVFCLFSLFFFLWFYCLSCYMPSSNDDFVSFCRHSEHPIRIHLCSFKIYFYFHPVPVFVFCLFAVVLHLTAYIFLHCLLRFLVIFPLYVCLFLQLHNPFFICFCNLGAFVSVLEALCVSLWSNSFSVALILLWGYTQ